MDVFLVFPVEIDHLSDISGDQQGQLVFLEDEFFHVDAHPDTAADTEKRQIGIQTHRRLEFNQLAVVADVDNAEIIAERNLLLVGKQFLELPELHIVHRRIHKNCNLRAS